MPTRLSRSLAVLFVSFVACGGLKSLRADSSDVSQIAIAKSAFFLQTSPADPVLELAPFNALIEIDAAFFGSIFAASVAPPRQNFGSLAGDGQGNFVFKDRYLTLNDLNTAFPEGTYFFDLLTATPPQRYSPFLTIFDRYPNLPKLLNNDWYGVVIQLDATQDFDFFWNDFAGFRTGGAQPSTIRFEIVDIFGSVVYRKDADFPANFLTLPANTLTPDDFYLGRLYFANTDVSQSGFTTFKGASILITEFLLNAIDGPPIIQEPLDLTVTVGQLFIYAIDAINSPGNFTASNLPPGVIFIDSLGLIGWFPTTPGTYQLPITATNSLGTGSATLTVRVLPSTGLAITSSTRAAGAKGDPFSFQVLAPGASSAARLSTSGLPPGLKADPVSGKISGTPTASGKFPVALRVTDGNATAGGFLELTFDSDPAFPGIVSPDTVTITAGQNFSYTIKAPVEQQGSSNATTFTEIGKLPTGLSFDAKTGTISGTFTGTPLKDGDPPDLGRLSGGALVGTVQLFASNAHGTATIPLVFFTTPVGAVNISTRMPVGTGENVLIGGFIVTGNAPKKLVVRGIGPSLRANGAPVPGTLQDPMLEVRAADATLLVANDNWKSDQQQEIVDTSVAPADDREAAIVGAFQPGNYTAILRGKDGSSGIGLVELYDLGTASLNASSNAQLAEISTRGTVQTGDNVMIGGFIISGGNSKVIVRAIGPELTGRGVGGALQDTTLQLFDGNGASLAFNDDWRSNQAQEIINTTVPPTDDRESAIVQTLVPGGYTAVVRGKNGTTGVALVEVYVLQ